MTLSLLQLLVTAMSVQSVQKDITFVNATMKLIKIILPLAPYHKRKEKKMVRKGGEWSWTRIFSKNL